MLLKYMINSSLPKFLITYRNFIPRRIIIHFCIIMVSIMLLCFGKAKVSFADFSFKSFLLQSFLCYG